MQSSISVHLKDPSPKLKAHPPLCRMFFLSFFILLRCLASSPQMSVIFVQNLKVVFLDGATVKNYESKIEVMWNKPLILV